MKLHACACLGLALLQAGGPGEPWDVSQTLARIAALHEDAEVQQALEIADACLAEATSAGHPDPDRAELHFARGVLLASIELSSDPPVERRTGAGGAFASARALAGPGELRLVGTYDLGTLHLEDGEALRARIPEIAGQSAPAASPKDPASDPLPRARRAYLDAKEMLLERIRLDGGDADTRANLELVARRLAELDEIEAQREAQQEPPEQDPKDPSETDPSKQDPSEQGEDKSAPSEGKQDPEDSQESGEKPDAEGEPAEPEPSAERDDAAQEEGKPREPSAEQTPPEGTEPAQAEAPAPGDSSPEPEELVLTKEEVQALLDHLAELEAQAQALEARMRATRAGRVKRDW